MSSCVSDSRPLEILNNFAIQVHLIHAGTCSPRDTSPMKNNYIYVTKANLLFIILMLNLIYKVECKSIMWGPVVGG